VWGEIKQVLEISWLGSLLGLVGLLSLPVSYIFYRLSKKRRLLSWACDSVALIDEPKGNAGDIQVTFHGNPVNRVTRTRIAIWNSGTEALRKTDLISADSLRFEFAADIRILRVQEIRMTKVANAVALSQNPTCPYMLFLAFEFLDHKDGAIFEVLHTGAMKAPTIKGVIVDLTAPIQFSIGSTAPKRHQLAWTGAATAFVLGALTMFESLSGTKLDLLLPDLFEPDTRVLISRGAEFVASVFLWVLAYIIWHVSRPVVPASLLLPVKA
jgi:hypothetical protein